MAQLNLTFSDIEDRPISPFRELGAYEALWDTSNASFKRIAEKFRTAPNHLPSDLVEPSLAKEYAFRVDKIIREAGITKYGIRVHGAGEYPERLRDAEYPVELLYYDGWWDLVNSPSSIAVVGTRNPSDDGISRAKKLVKKLVADDFTIVSGLARGIDTIAHKTAIAEGGRTIGVLGTPINKHYPAENEQLQRDIAETHLIVSQVPVQRYERAKSPTHNNVFFPERNKTMSALTDATIIVEAGETSGTLVQARAALKQNRKLFILESCFHNPNLSWPHKFAKLGAIRVRDYDDVRNAFAAATLH